MTARTLPARHQWRDALVFTTGIDAFAKAVAGCLHGHMDHTGRASVGLRRLAHLSGCSVPTVRKRIGWLTAAGWLTVEGGHGQRAVYRATFPAAGAVDKPGRPEPSVQPQRGAHPESVQPETTRSPNDEPLAPLPPGRRRRRARPWRPFDQPPPARRDPSIGRPPLDRPPPDVGGLVERADGTWWVTS